MDDQQHDADSDQNLASQQQPGMATPGQHEKQADYRGPASDGCQGVAHHYIIARGSGMIATLPPSDHVNALRSFIERIRRTRTIPTAQEFAHAMDSLRALEGAISQKGSKT
jgi:hypothetical protein